ncbi:hypothetical protein ONZ45_g5776 [Pleurotus djamor]|nr:hypothetical protein ONZ45_g5776 [Pleurotus djamor]
MSRIRNPSSYYGTENIAAFLKQAMLGKTDPDMPAHWRGFRLEELASNLAEAYDKRVVLPVTAERLTKATLGQRTRLLAGIELGDVANPLLVLSSDGIPLIVYLPALMSAKSQMGLAQSVSQISSILMKPLTDKKRSQLWRTAPKHFAQPGRTGTSTEAVEIVASQEKRRAGWFLVEAAPHGQRTINALKESDDDSTAYWAKRWPSAFSCLSVLANRRSRLHVDGKGDVNQFDMLFNTGTADTVIRLRQLGAIFAYPPGAAMMFSGVCNMSVATAKYKRYQDTQKIRQFLDIEAQIDPSDDDEDDEVPERDFLDDRGDDEAPTRAIRSMPILDPEAEHAGNEASATAIRMRHGRIEPPRTASSSAVFATETWSIESGWGAGISLMPSLTDPDLWQVDVQEGKEVETVALILSQAMERAIPLQSAFQRDHIPGVVYIEGPYSDCIRAIENLSTVRLRRRQIKSLIQIVDVADRVSLLHLAPAPTVRPSTLVRIRNRSLNRNNVAFVNAVNGHTAELFSVYRSRSSSPQQTLAMDVRPDQAHGLVSRPKNVRRKFIEGLRIHSIPLHLLQTTFVNPTSAELDALCTSPLFDAELLVGPSDMAEDHTLEKSQRFTQTIIRARKSLNTFSIGEKVAVVSGLFSGIRGTIREIVQDCVVLQVLLDEDLPPIEVPLDELSASTLHTPGTHVSVVMGPYSGLNGRVMSTIDEHHVVLQPSAKQTQSCEVALRSIARDFQVGDHIKVLRGQHAGTMGFVVKNDLWQVDVFVKETMSMIPVGADVAVLAPMEVTRGDIAPQRVTSQTSGPERFKHLEVQIIGQSDLKGRIGTIVGHRYTVETSSNAKPNDKHLMFEVRVGTNISHYTHTFKPSELQELRTGLPILIAARLPRSIVDPPRFAPGHKRARTPEVEPDVDVEEYIWRPGPHEGTRPEKVHWLLKVPIHSKVKVVVQGTTEGDVHGFHRAAYRAGRYEGMEGTVVLTKALVDERSSVNVRVQDQTNRLFKILYLYPLQNPAIFIVGARVVIIGPDVEGNTTHEGQYGFISACAYPLAERQRLLFIQPNMWAYYDLASLCFSGDITEWQGGLH